MSDRDSRRDIPFTDRLKEKSFMLITIGSLILNLLIFALVIRDSAIISLVLAAAFLIYVPVCLFDDQEGFVMWCARIFEIIVALALTISYIFLFKKFLLLILPIFEIAGAILFYIFVYRRNYW